jgi:thioredoxin-like negative regulator of GroEL
MRIRRFDSLPVYEIEEVKGEGHYVKHDGRPVARFDGPTAYDDATRCCATLVQNEINKIEQAPPVAPHDRYRELLREIADLRYPDASAEFRTRIEASIDFKVGKFMAEQGTLKTHTREQQRQQQQQPPPPIRQQQRGMDRGGYEQ